MNTKIMIQIFMIYVSNFTHFFLSYFRPSKTDMGLRLLERP